MSSDAPVRLPAAIIFDFDGTLVDSNGPKEAAFYELARKQNPKGDDRSGVEAMRAVMTEFGKESRYVILQEWLEQCEWSFADQAAIEQEVRRLAAAYDELAVAAAVSCAPMPGALALLETWCGRLPLFVSSVTPHDSLERILRQREWTHYFQRWSGYPANKSETVRQISSELGVPVQQLLVVGDGPSDERSATETGADFWPAGSPEALLQLEQRLNGARKENKSR